MIQKVEGGGWTVEAEWGHVTCSRRFEARQIERAFRLRNDLQQNLGSLRENPTIPEPIKNVILGCLENVLRGKWGSWYELARQSVYCQSLLALELAERRELPFEKRFATALKN
jgi:hypothetical protein